MRSNQPVTQKEYQLDDNATLMSTTDSQSYVRYANAAFVDASGFGIEEIEGQPHNFIRHPDMPREAFADLWATLKGGEPWSALLKNRRKNGDHYWVRANAVPVVRGGKQTGFMSVRTKPSREEVAMAEALYKRFREGKAGGKRFFKGLIRRSGPLALLSIGQWLSVRWRIRATLLCLLAVLLTSTWLMHISGISFGLYAMAMSLELLLADLLLEQQIARPVERLQQQALKVASGASQEAQRMNRVDEIGMTLRSIGQLGLMFRWVIDDVSEQVVRVQNAVTAIATGNDNLNQRTETMANHVQETAASMEQMLRTVRSSADAARQASQLSVAASAAVARGGSAMAEVVSTMQGIAGGSEKIANIIGVIDSIAFQTNILALNASVEAARAGEQGRGFAVVAQEVRNLAQRSAAAANEIKALINASVEQVNAGTHLVNDTEATMADIMRQVRRVTDLISEISAAAAEQSSGIEQVNQAVVSLDRTTQENALLVEKSTYASRNLQAQADSLAEAVSVFR
jgi:aerotaxis receptor